MREAITHRCFRCCGVCNGNDKAQKITDELAREFDDAFMAVDPSRLVRHDEHARRNALGFVMAYTDGSASNTGCRATARAGWGVFYGAGSRHNVASHLSGPVQSSTRSELRAILEVFRCIAHPPKSSPTASTW